MIIVHHLNNSRSHRVLWLLEELGVPYELKFYQRDPVTMLAPSELKQVHPLGKSPVLTDGDISVAESGAILEYLLERHGGGRLQPAMGTPEARKFTYWMHYAEGSAMPPLLLSLIFSKMAKTPAPFFVRPILKQISAKAMAMLVTPQLKTHFDFMESELGRSEWFAGREFSAADIQMSFAVEAGEARRQVGAARPRLVEFLKKIRARPAYQRAVERGGPYELMG